MEIPHSPHVACVKAGLRKFEKQSNNKKNFIGSIPPDLRRCAARNLSRAGVSEQVAMRVMGHKTRSMYRRYRIVDDKEKREAMDKVQTHLVNEPNDTSTKAAG